MAPTFEAMKSMIAKRNILEGDGIAQFAKRAATNFILGQGSTPPEDFHNAGILALFAIIGLALVVATIWFFFWAKNGGFIWRKGDWEDYKSTVLRRKGPDGRTLSNATKSTRLGGGTIAGTQRYAWEKHAARSVVGRDSKGRKGWLGRRGWAGTHSMTYSDDYTGTLASRTVTDEMTELRSEPDTHNPHTHHDPSNHHSKRYRDRDVTAYKKEKPARVGGINRVADSSPFNSTVASQTLSALSERSDLLSDSGRTDLESTSSGHPILPKHKSTTKDTHTKSHRHSKPRTTSRAAPPEYAETEYTDAHTTHQATPRQDADARARARAERKARDDAKKMERRWKAEASAAAEALARENVRGPPAAVPGRSRYVPVEEEESPRRTLRTVGRERVDRNAGAYEASEAESGGRSVSGSYYDAYRPRQQGNGGRKTGGGYRRGGGDSDFD